MIYRQFKLSFGTLHVTLCLISQLKLSKRNQSLVVPADQYLVSASSSGDKLVVSSLKSNPVPVVELADGVSEESELLCCCVCMVHCKVGGCHP